MRIKGLLFLVGVLLLFALEILRVYFIMPFPGSQHDDTLAFAYFLDRNILWLRIIALLLAIPAGISLFRKAGTAPRAFLLALLALYVLIFYCFNFRFLADKMFYPPKQTLFAAVSADTTNKDRLVIGVALHGVAKAYPIEIIGYHHQVRDTLGGEPILVTYCTVCRTGRVFSPIVNGQPAIFRLVGMDHFNAMFEDVATKSWWQQATGIAVAGPLKGQKMQEIPSAQMRLGDWIALHPDNLTLQPDPHFRARYDSLRGYDEGRIDGSLERRDSASWHFKSWIVGVDLHGHSRAYDWNELAAHRVIADTLAGSRLLLTLADGDKTFCVFTIPDSLQLHYDPTANNLSDPNHTSTWNLSGKCLSGKCLTGPQQGQRLPQIQAYQEFWHSWRTFHPATTRYNPAPPH